jgi:hypothetical protein
VRFLGHCVSSNLEILVMNTAILKRARELWANPDVSVCIQRHNIRAWVRSVRFLGNKHLLAIKITKKDES